MGILAFKKVMNRQKINLEVNFFVQHHVKS